MCVVCVGGKHTKLCGGFDSQSVKDWTVLAMYKKNEGEEQETDDDDDEVQVDEEEEEEVEEGSDADKKKNKDTSGCECYDCVKHVFESVVNEVVEYFNGANKLFFTGDIKMLQLICGMK